MSVSAWRTIVICAAVEKRKRESLVPEKPEKRGQRLEWSRGWEMKNATVMLKRRSEEGGGGEKRARG